jgi:hypothetical protein
MVRCTYVPYNGVHTVTTVGCLQPCSAMPCHAMPGGTVEQILPIRGHPGSAMPPRGGSMLATHAQSTCQSPCPSLTMGMECRSTSWYGRSTNDNDQSEISCSDGVICGGKGRQHVWTSLSQAIHLSVSASGFSPSSSSRSKRFLDLANFLIVSFRGQQCRHINS